MGYYIEVPSNLNKADQLVELYQAEEVPLMEVAKHDFWKKTRQAKKVPVVVLHNGFFEAAGIAYSKRELSEFLNPSDTRYKRVVVMSEGTIKELVPYCPLQT